MTEVMLLELNFNYDNVIIHIICILLHGSDL